MKKDVSKQDVSKKAVSISDLEMEEQSASFKKSMSFVVSRVLPIPKQWSAEELEKAEFPKDMTALSLDELGRLMSVWTSIIAYTQFEVAKADVEYSALSRQLDYNRKLLYLKLSGKEGYTEEMKRAEMVVNDVVARISVQTEYARARLTLLKALLSAYGKYYTALSRELSRREVVEPTQIRREDKAKQIKHRQGGTSLSYDLEALFGIGEDEQEDEQE